MRILGQIEHPTLKITVFKMENRLTLKIENDRFEQSHKILADGQIESLADVRKLVDAEFLEAAQRIFQAMHQARLGAFSRVFPPSDVDVFEKIV